MRALTRRSFLAVGAGLCGAALSGCSLRSGSAPEPTPAVPGPPLADDPPLPRLTLRKLWSSPERTGLTDILDSTLVDGVLLAEGRTPNGSSAGLQAIELSSGTVRWSAETVADAVEKATKGARLFEAGTTIAGAGSSAVVFGSTYRSPCPQGKEGLCHSSETSTTAERGVVALSAADGAVRWFTVVSPSVRREAGIDLDGDSVVVVAADGSSAIVAVGSGRVIRGQYTADENDRCRTVVLEASTGRQRWAVDDLLPLAVADDVVIALEPTGALGNLRDPYVPVVALDLRTGRRRWSSTDSLGKVRWQAARSGILAVATPDGVTQRQHLLDPATGRTLTDTLPGGAGAVLLGESATGQPMAAWTVADQRGPVYTLTLPDRGPVMSARSPNENTGLIGGRIHRGYLWCGELGEGSVTAIDRSGHDCSDTVPSFLVGAVDDRHLVMLHRGKPRGTDRAGFTVYAIG